MSRQSSLSFNISIVHCSYHISSILYKFLPSHRLSEPLLVEIKFVVHLPIVSITRYLLSAFSFANTALRRSSVSAQIPFCRCLDLQANLLSRITAFYNKGYWIGSAMTSTLMQVYPLCLYWSKSTFRQIVVSWHEMRNSSILQRNIPYSCIQTNFTLMFQYLEYAYISGVACYRLT